MLCEADLPGGDFLCKACLHELPWQQQSCTCCGLKMASAHGSMLCGGCQHHPPYYSSTTVLFEHAEPVRSLIHALKFHHRLAVAEFLGGLLAERLSGYERSRSVDWIVPVPLHGRRLAERGFNQAVELARPIARQLAIPLALRACKRVRATEAQSRLNAKQRQKNLKGAFVVDPGLAGSHVAIVDDVMTTGNTVNELAQSLKRAGVVEVSVWVCARAS